MVRISSSIQTKGHPDKRKERKKTKKRKKEYIYRKKTKREKEGSPLLDLCYH